MAVNKANIIEWLYALNSGRYKQGEGALCKAGKYCCLGVACKVAREHGVEMDVRTEPDVENPDEMVTYWDLGAWTLPVKVQEWLGVESPNPMLAGRDASWWNDAMKLPFAGIAALITNEYGITSLDFYESRRARLPSSYSLSILAALQAKHVYAGTVPRKEVTRRRKAGKAARLSRKVNRG